MAPSPLAILWRPEIKKGVLNAFKKNYFLILYLSQLFFK